MHVADEPSGCTNTRLPARDRLRLADFAEVSANGSIARPSSRRGSEADEIDHEEENTDKSLNAEAEENAEGAVRHIKATVEHEPIAG